MPWEKRTVAFSSAPPIQICAIQLQYLYEVMEMGESVPVAIPSQEQKKKQPFTKQKRWTDGDNNPCLTVSCE